VRLKPPGFKDSKIQGFMTSADPQLCEWQLWTQVAVVGLAKIPVCLGQMLAHMSGWWHWLAGILQLFQAAAGDVALAFAL
jgi:hypothetical protein